MVSLSNTIYVLNMGSSCLLYDELRLGRTFYSFIRIHIYFFIHLTDSLFFELQQLFGCLSITIHRL